MIRALNRMTRIASRMGCCAALALLLVSVSCNDSSTTTPAAGGRKTIAVIPKGTSHVFWKSVEFGARKAGKELDVDIKWDGPPTEAERGTQIRIISDMQSKGVDALVIAPLDNTAITAAMEGAAKKMPVVVFDSGSTFKDYKAFVATDNFQGGVLAAQQMLKVLPKDKDIYLAVVRYDSASDSTLQREKGFLTTIEAAKDPRIKEVFDKQYAGDSADKATTLMANMLQAHKEINAVFASNESTTRGALGALDKAQLLGKITFIGFDSSPQLVEAFEKGQIQALVLQDPIKMGYLSVKAAVASLKGEKVDKEQPISPTLVTPENKDKPEIQQLLKPKFD